jgi:hypothetical protein
MSQYVYVCVCVYMGTYSHKYVLFKIRVMMHPCCDILSPPGRGRQDVISDGSLFYAMCNKDYSLSNNVLAKRAQATITTLLPA